MDDEGCGIICVSGWRLVELHKFLDHNRLLTMGLRSRMRLQELFAGGMYEEHRQAAHSAEVKIRSEAQPFEVQPIAECGGAHT
jgi:hypothetical protein